MEGWVKLHRKSLESAVFQNPKLWTVWSYCLMRANHKETKVLFNGRDIILQPGQFITGRFEGSKDCNMNPSTFRNQIALLKRMKNLDIKSDNKKSIITIVNWTFYQCEENKMDSRKDTKRTTEGHRQECNNERKEIYNSDSIEYKISEHLFSLILKNNPNNKKPDFQQWCIHVNRMINLDKRKPEEIISVANWCQQDSFWKSNILSTDKLRKQFDKLFIKMNSSKPDLFNQNNYQNNESLTNRMLL